jgi:hypothetical protein
MDSNTIIVENNNSYYVGAFLLLIIIIIIIVVVILLLVPKSTVALFGACTEQSECSNGLICNGNGATGGICLGGLNYQCNNNSDCAKNYFCLDNSFTNTKVCMYQPQITTTSNNPSFAVNSSLPIGNPITVAPVINLSLPQNMTPMAQQPYNTMQYNPQAILNSILPPSSPSNYNFNSGAGSARQFRSFAPMTLMTGKKKL